MNALKKNLTDSGKKIQDQVKKTTQEFADKHPEEIEKLKTTLNKSTETVGKQAKKLNINIPASNNLRISSIGKKKEAEENHEEPDANTTPAAEKAVPDPTGNGTDQPADAIPPTDESNIADIDRFEQLGEQGIVQEAADAQATMQEEKEELATTITTASTTIEEKVDSAPVEEEEPAKIESAVGSSVTKSKSQFEYPTPLSEAVAAVSTKSMKMGDDDDDGSESGSSGSGSDSENWEDSGDEAWPASNSRYAPVGVAQSLVSRRGASRLAREFTLGAGFHHLNEAGNKIMNESPANTILPPPGNSLGSQQDFNGGSKKSLLSHYSKAAIDLMKHHNLENIGLRMNKPTYLDKVLLVTDAPHSIRLYIGDDDGPCIVGIALIREGIVFTSGILSEEIPPLTLNLDPDRPVLDSIELQSCTWLEGKDDVEKKLSYMRLSCGSDTLTFGEVHTDGFDGNRSIYSEVEAATGKLVLSGIGYFDNKPITLQVVDLGKDCGDVIDAMDTCVYYNNGVISGNVIRTRGREVEFLNSIITEDDAVWDVMAGCMDAVENSSPSYGELLPNAVNLLEKSLSGDVHSIHAVLRLDRFLTNTIQEKKSIQTFDNDHWNFYSKLIPMKQMWGIFSNTTERIKRIHSYQPELNSFSVAFLEGTEEYLMQAIFIFLTQLTLLILTLSHIWTHRAEAFHIPSPLRLIVSICGTIVVNYMAKQSKNNFEDFATIFPEYIGTPLYKLDEFSNIIGGVLVTISTLLLLLMTNDNLDIVLNATALLFVLELDEMMVDKNPVWITGVYRAYFMKDIINELNESDKRYWDPEYLRKDRGEHYRIHTPSCSLLFTNDKK